MKLLEVEGKALLAAHGMALPRAGTWPQVPESVGGWVVKAQTLAGGRGKRGGIRRADSRDELQRHAFALHGGYLGDDPIHAVLVEERLEIAHEYYLAAMVDRDRGRVRVLASVAGGMDIESVPQEQIASIEIDPLIGLAGFQVQHLRRFLALTGDVATRFEAAVAQVVDTLVGEDAELVEVNPLVCTADGRLLAADAKVVLDDDAVARHPGRAGPVAWASDSAFMQRCRELDVIGVDNRARLAANDGGPSVAILGNGAGLTMATYDQVALGGTDVAGAIELHGALARGVEHTARVFGAFFLLRADIYLVNAFYQLRSTDALAEALIAALAQAGAPARERVVTRMRGVNQQHSERLVKEAGIYYSPSLREATDEAVSRARAAAAGRGTR